MGLISGGQYNDASQYIRDPVASGFQGVGVMFLKHINAVGAKGAADQFGALLVGRLSMVEIICEPVGKSKGNSAAIAASGGGIAGLCFGFLWGKCDGSNCSRSHELPTGDARVNKLLKDFSWTKEFLEAKEKEKEKAV